MKLALECPVEFMEDLLPLTDFDFILTHLVKGKYLDQYQERRMRGRWSVLDNGTNELGHPCSIKEIDEAALVLNRDLVVPPDYLGEGNKTLEGIKEGVKVWGLDKVLPVVQGENEIDLRKCYRSIRNLGFSRIAVPYDICLPRDSIGQMALEGLGMNRRRLISQMLNMDPKVEIHLLGLNSLQEISWYRDNCPQVVSLDTGSPFLNASRCIRFGKGNLLPKGIYIDYGKEKESYWKGTVELARDNIRYLKEVMERGEINDN